MTDKTSWVDSLWLSPTDILHEHHYIGLVVVPKRILPNCQLGATVYLGDRERDQVSKHIRHRRRILEYFVVQLLSP